MKNLLCVVNLEEGYPTVDKAIKKLDSALYEASINKIKVMRIIHGYGSSGKGGRIKKEVNKYLQLQVKRNGITDFINGESWTIYCDKTRTFLDVCNSLRKDKFLDQYNYGITYVML